MLNVGSTSGGAFLAYMFTLLSVLLFGLIIYAITAFFMAKVFEKAGVEGKWRAWVPVYNNMIFFKLGDLSPWLVLYCVAGGILLSVVGIGFIFSLALFGGSFVAAYRIGQKLGTEPAMVAMWIIPIVWLIVMGTNSNRWNTDVEPAPWKGNGFLEDRTEWNGVPVQAAGQVAP